MHNDPFHPFVHGARSDWFGQPRGLTILFLTEMWTQFSFYGMRALLVLYMTKQLHIAQAEASWIYGGYAAMVYLMPIAGGIVADRWLGKRNAVVIGALIMAAGHFVMSFESLLYVALATITIGNGLFLPSLPSQSDGLYSADDPRRAGAYNVYYVGINLGAFAAPLVIGTVGELYGFHYGFAIAGIGMIIAIATYLAGGAWLPKDGRRSRSSAAPRHDLARADLLARFALLAAIAGAVVVFRAGYEQLGNTVSLWADADVDRHVAGGGVIPVTWFQSLNPLLVFVVSPFLIAHWTRVGAKGHDRGAVSRMVAGAALVGLSYLAVAAITQWTSGLVAWPWLAGFITLMTIGELYILPVGLGLFGRLAPTGLNATTIALWFSAGFAGNLLAAWLGGFFTTLARPLFFSAVAAAAFMAAAMLALLAKRARQLETSV